MRSVSFKDKKFYYFLDNSQSIVLNQTRQRVTLKEVNQLGFKSLGEFCVFLEKLWNSRTKIEYYDEQKVCELISQNLITHELVPISTSLAKSLLKGINYQIVKVKDHNAGLDLLQKIATKNKLVFNKIVLDVKIKKLDLSLKRYFRSPWGEYTKENISLAPILVEPVLKALQKQL